MRFGAEAGVYREFIAMSRLSIGVVGGLVLAWVACAGVSLSAQNPGGSAAARAMRNPVAPNAASIKLGMQIYQKNCQFCHGPTGLGDGPLTPEDMNPANLVDEEWERGSTDGEIFAVISEGAGPEFQMKGASGRIADPDIWSLVNYLRSIGPETATR